MPYTVYVQLWRICKYLDITSAYDQEYGELSVIFELKDIHINEPVTGVKFVPLTGVTFS